MNDFTSLEKLPPAPPGPGPAVTVVIPTYNRADLLPAAIDSVLSQTFTDFELIVVDDGSTDNTLQMLAGRYGTRIRVLRHPKNRGLPAALNTGIRAGSGRFFAFNDSDDLWTDPDKLQKQVQALSNAPQTVGVAFCGLVRVMGKKEIHVPGPCLAGRDIITGTDLLDFNLYNQMALVRRACYEVAGLYDEDLNSLEDRDFYLRVAETFRFLYVPGPMIRSEVLPDSNFLKEARQIRTYETVLKRHYPRFLKHPRHLAGRQFRLGQLHCRFGDFKEGRALLHAALRTRIFFPKALGACLLAALLPAPAYRALFTAKNRLAAGIANRNRA